MILYLIIIVIAVLVIATAVSLITASAFFTVLGWTALATAVVMAIDGLTATLCQFLPEKLANHEKKLFVVSAEEKKFYEKLKIRKWKDKVPEIAGFTGFHKNKLADPKSVEYVERFLLETCYGELVHSISCFASYLILLLFPLTELWLAVAIPVATVSMLLNLPSLFILRYNSYKLRILRESMLKKQQRAGNK